MRERRRAQNAKEEEVNIGVSAILGGKKIEQEKNKAVKCNEGAEETKKKKKATRIKVKAGAGRQSCGRRNK